MAYPIEIGNALTYLFLFAYPLSIILSDLNRFYEIETELERVLCVYLCVFYFNFNCSMFPLHSYPEHSTFKAEDKQYLVFNKHLYGIQLYLGIQQVVSWLYCTQSCVCLCLRYADSTDTLAFFSLFHKGPKNIKASQDTVTAKKLK